MRRNGAGPWPHFDRKLRMAIASAVAYLGLMNAIDDEASWEAVVRRDRRFDGRFVFAVSSTGIYCRPSCPSRRPRRENVRFFAATGAAAADGYRACLRCHPDDQRVPLEQRVRLLLDAAGDGAVTLAELAVETGVSPHHLQRTFKNAFGITPRQYLAGRRVERLKAHLRRGDDVTSAIYEAGYGSGSRLYSQSNDRLGMTPGTYRDGGAGMEIAFTTVSTQLGELLVAMTVRGICAVSLGESSDALERALRQELPRAAVTRSDDPELARTVAGIVAQIEEGRPAGEMPLDLHATAFQLRVWDALRKIPYGQTRSYSEVAAAIGSPAAVRAVASACARNRVALVIPCHRVIREDGHLGGYRWGIDRKRTLLEKERR
jgi:AraC family transcriptional regulator of adaptative response/methylated-DNA-[protein]-cysteine methyltransferase